MFGFAQVILALKNKTLNFYVGIASVTLYIYVFYSFGLFAESLLNCYYLIISIAGIFFWQQRSVSKISFTKSSERIIVISLFGISWATLFFILNKYTTSDVPQFDAFVTAAAWVGTWLLMKRKVENWLVLNVSNLAAIPLHIYKGLELTSILTCIYFVVAIRGYVVWREEAKASLINQM